MIVPLPINSKPASRAMIEKQMSVPGDGASTLAANNGN
jgi:hypothetical protein